MLKYNKTIENDNYILPLINKYENGYIELRDSKIPFSFFNEYKQLFNKCKRMIEYFDEFDRDNYKNKDYSKMSDILSEYDTICFDKNYVMDNYNKVDITSRGIYNYLKMCKSINEIYFMINNIDGNTKEYDKAIIDVSKYLKIKVDPTKKRIVNYKLPYAWFINKQGELYNTTGNNGHKQSTLQYCLASIKYCMMLNNPIDDYYTRALAVKNDINKNKGIIRTQFQDYLNLKDSFVSIDDCKYFDQISHNKNIIEIVNGIVTAQIDFYSFFNKIQKECDEPYIELSKVLEYTNNDISDILVRCCGYHKVESSTTKEITTSCLNYENELKEYIDNGWKITIIPPIVLQNNEIKIYNTDELFIKRLISKR